jgi:hypothetical protein
VRSQPLLTGTAAPPVISRPLSLSQAAPPLSPPGPMYPLPVAPPSHLSLLPIRRSAILAGLLECLMPGVGLIYAGSGWAGALTLVGTAAGAMALLLIGLGTAPHTRPLALVRYFLFCGALLFLWLVARIIWAALAAQRRNEAAQIAAPIASPPTTHGAPYGTAPGPPSIRG